MAKRKKKVYKVKKIDKRKRTSYSIEQKIQVVKYAKEQGNKNASNHINIDLSMVGRWVTASSNWNFETNEKSKRLGSGRKSFFPEAEKRLYNWVIGQRKQGLAVSYAILRSKMVEILKEADILELYESLAENFKMSQC